MSRRRELLLATKTYVINVRDNFLVAAEYTPGVTV